MKYMIVRCEDGARLESPCAPLLEGAKTAFLQQLAQAGAAGIIQQHVRSRLIPRLAIHRGLLGLEPAGAEPPAGQCYAASVNMALAEGDSVWCCDFATQHDGTVVDPTAGQITTKESAVLIQALNMQLGSETRRWEVGSGAHHLLITRDPALQSESAPKIPSPEALIDEAWSGQLPRHDVAEAVRQLVEQAQDVLEHHPVNQVRVDLGQNPANFMWLWGGAARRSASPFKQRTGLSGAVVSHSFPVRGLAKTLALDWKPGPVTLDEISMDRLATDVTRLVQQHDFIYVHLRIVSEDPVDRLCAMERIDQRLLKPLTKNLSTSGPWRLLAALDDRPAGSVPFVAVGSSLPQPPSAQGRKPQFNFADSGQLFSWLTAP